MCRGPRCRKFIGWCRGIDLLGSGVELNVGGDSTYKTLTGALLSLAVLGIVIFFLVQVIIRIFDRTNPTVTAMKEYDLANFRYDLHNSELLPIIILLEKSTGRVITAQEAPKYVTFRAKYAAFVFNETSNTLGEISASIPVGLCDSLQNRKPYQYYWDEDYGSGSMASSLLCLDVPSALPELNIQGNKFSLEHYFMRVELLPCSLPNKLDCATSQQINDVRLGMMTKKKYLDHKNFSNPIHKINNLREEISLMQTGGVTLFNYVKKTIVQDETNLLQPKNEDKEFLEISYEENNPFMRSGMIDCTVQDIDAFPRKCDPYVIMEMKSSGLQETYTRTYTDLMTAFSDIGGFKELVLLGAVLIYTYYNGHYKDRHIVESIVPLSALPLQMVDRPVQKNNKSFNEIPQSNELPSPTNRNESSVANLLVMGKVFQDINNPEQANEGAGLDNQMRSLSDVKEQVEANIQKFTNISTVVKELANWRVLKDIIFTPYQKKLLPLVALETERRRKIVEEHQIDVAEQIRNSTTNPAILQIANFVGETIDYKSALEELLSNSRHPTNSVSSSLESRINNFIIEHLPDLVWKDEASSHIPLDWQPEETIKYNYKDPTERGASGNVSEDNHWKPSPMISPETPSFLPPVSIDNVNLSPQNNLNNQQGMYS